MATLGAHDPAPQPPSAAADPPLADQHADAYDPQLPVADRRAGLFGALYRVCGQHSCVMRPLTRALWGVDVSPLYRTIRLIGSLQGACVADVPCGTGVAFGALAPGQDVRYLAIDPDPDTLRRAERRARRRSLTQIDFQRAELTALPFADGEIDVFLCFGAIHLLDDRDGALAEIARCLSPGGVLVGTSFFSDIGARGRHLFELGARRGHPLPPSREQMYKSMYASGLVEGTLGPDYGFASFRARKPPDTRGPVRSSRRAKARSPRQERRRP